MPSTLRILIAADSETTVTLNEYFKKKGDISVLGVAEDGETVCSMINSLNPDLVFMDLMLPGTGGIDVLMQYQGEPDAPAFIVISAVRDSKLIDQAIKFGAKYVVLKPFQPEDLYGRMKLLTCKNPQYSGANETTVVYESTKPIHYFFKKSDYDDIVEFEIMKVLYQIGIPSSIKGFHFIKDAVFMVLVEPSSILAITKDIYPAIAAKHFTTRMNVERAIRHAFSVSWERGTYEGKVKVFGKGFDFSKGVKNSDAISIIATRVEYTLRMKFRQN